MSDEEDEDEDERMRIMDYGMHVLFIECVDEVLCVGHSTAGIVLAGRLPYIPR